jgi:hypothetical protein
MRRQRWCQLGIVQWLRGRCWLVAAGSVERSGPCCGWAAEMGLFRQLGLLGGFVHQEVTDRHRERAMAPGMNLDVARSWVAERTSADDFTMDEGRRMMATFNDDLPSWFSGVGWELDQEMASRYLMWDPAPVHLISEVKAAEADTAARGAWGAEAQSGLWGWGAV